jgi:hypothetical protein
MSSGLLLWQPITLAEVNNAFEILLIDFGCNQQPFTQSLNKD